MFFQGEISNFQLFAVVLEKAPSYPKALSHTRPTVAFAHTSAHSRNQVPSQLHLWWASRAGLLQKHTAHSSWVILFSLPESLLYYLFLLQGWHRDWTQLSSSHWCHEQEGTLPAGVCDCPFRGGIRGVFLCSLCLSSKFFSRQLLSEAASCKCNLHFWFQMPYLAFDFLNLKASFPGLWPVLSHSRSLCIDSPVGLVVSLLPVLLASADLATTRISIVSCRSLIKNTEWKMVIGFSLFFYPRYFCPV